MKKLELLEEKIEVSFKGESHEMRLPSNQELMDLRKNEEGSEDDSIELMYGFFGKLGLPEEFTKSLTPSHLVRLMEATSEVKS